jgi:hypothetical protein
MLYDELCSEMALIENYLLVIFFFLPFMHHERLFFELFKNIENVIQYKYEYYDAVLSDQNSMLSNVHLE